jgi:hypothetical protein
MTHDSPRLEATPITLRARNKETENCEVSAMNARAVATRIAAVVVALKDGGAQHDALSILPFLVKQLVKQLVKLASVCTKDDQKSAPRSTSRELYGRLEVLFNAR